MKKLGFAMPVFAALLLIGEPASPGEKEPPRVLRQAAGPQGIPVADLLESVTKVTGDSFLFNPADPLVAARKVHFTGTQNVPVDEALAWLQAVLFHQKIVLVPSGPPEQRRWSVLNANDPAVANHAIPVPEDQLEAWADRDGAYITVVLTVKNQPDTTRLRNALANMTTRPVGRIQDVPGRRALVVSDFAPKVHAMAELLKEMDVVPEPRPSRPRTVSRVAPRPSPPVDARQRAIERYEQMLMSARTDTAAGYLVERIQKLRAEARKPTADR